MSDDLVQKRQLLAEQAERERELIADEVAAERALLKAQQRLAKIEGDYEAIKRERNERKAAVLAAKAMLNAVQRRRAAGPAEKARPTPSNLPGNPFGEDGPVPAFLLRSYVRSE